MQEPDGGSLSIGELARQTGVAAATLRMWETRHGFPVATRLASGHRRYQPSTVDRVRSVVRRQTAGVRLEEAIAQARTAASANTSVHASLRRAHPELVPQVLTKGTLVALSHAIEDECVALAEPAVLFGAFQRATHLSAALPRWRDLASTARSTVVFSDECPEALPGAALLHVPLEPADPMRREWGIVCDGTTLPVALSAWELPGQEEKVADPDRRFECVWTLDPAAVRTASVVCAKLADQAGHAPVRELIDELPVPTRAGISDLAAASRLFSRVVGYVDRAGRRT